MKPQQYVMLLLIALFVGAYQNSTIHSKHHHIDEMSECHVCHTSEQLDHGHHQSTTPIVGENIAVKTRKHVEKIVVKTRFDHQDTPPFKKVDIVETHRYFVLSSPLGFLATAPPYPYTS